MIVPGTSAMAAFFPAICRYLAANKERKYGNTLIGPVEIPPQNVKIDLRKEDRCGKHRRGNPQLLLQLALGDLQIVRNNHPGAAESRITGRDRQDDYAKYGAGTTYCAQGHHLYLAHHVSRPARMQGGLQAADIVKQAHGGGCPYHRDDGLSHHHSVKDPTPVDLLLNGP